MTVWTDSVDYPGAALLDLLNEGTFYDFVPSWYLDGIVNFTEPLRAFMLVRYEASGHKEAIAAIENQHIGHVCRHDDVILFRTSHGGARLWAFYFDRDSSDCGIGWVFMSPENQAAMLMWAEERAREAFDNYEELRERNTSIRGSVVEPQEVTDGALLEIHKLPGYVLW